MAVGQLGFCYSCFPGNVLWVFHNFQMCSRKYSRYSVGWKEDTMLISKAMPVKINTGRQKVIRMWDFALLDGSFTSGNCLSRKLKQDQKKEKTTSSLMMRHSFHGQWKAQVEKQNQELYVSLPFPKDGKNVGFRECLFFFFSVISHLWWRTDWEQYAQFISITSHISKRMNVCFTFSLLSFSVRVKQREVRFAFPS